MIRRWFILAAATTASLTSTRRLEVEASAPPQINKPTPTPVPVSKFKFNFSGFHIYETRSPNTDTDYSSLTVRVGSAGGIQRKQYVGDLGVGDHGFDLIVEADVPNLGTPVVVGWAVVNNNDGKDSALNLIGNIGLGIVGDGLTYIPVVGTVLSAIFSAIVNPFRNHNGPVVAQQYITNGTALHQIPVGKSIGPLNSYGPGKGAKNYGRDLPGKEHSDYDSVVWVTRLT